MSIQTSGPVNELEFDLADRLRKALRHADVSVEALSDDLGYSRKSVGNWLNGRAVPRRSVIVAWAFRCGVNPQWLETGEAPQPPEPGPEGTRDLGIAQDRCSVQGIRRLVLVGAPLAA